MGEMGYFLSQTQQFLTFSKFACQLFLKLYLMAGINGWVEVTGFFGFLRKFLLFSNWGNGSSIRTGDPVLLCTYFTQKPWRLTSTSDLM